MELTSEHLAILQLSINEAKSWRKEGRELRNIGPSCVVMPQSDVPIWALHELVDAGLARYKLTPPNQEVVPAYVLTTEAEQTIQGLYLTGKLTR